MPGDLIGTRGAADPLAAPERTLMAVTRGAAGVGVLLALLGGLSLALTALLHGVSGHAVLGGGALIVGGGLWAVAQGFVARWLSGRAPRSLLAAVMQGVVAVLLISVGWGTLVGFSRIPLGVAVVVALAEWALVRSVDPAWRSRGPGADVVKPVSEMDEMRVMRWLALAGTSLGVAAGVVVTLQFFYYVLNWEQDLNALGAYASVYFFAVVGAWCAPQLVLLAWTGGGGRSGAPLIVLGALAWAALVWAVSGDEGLALLIPLLAGGVLVLEVVVGCMVAWRRLG